MQPEPTLRERWLRMSPDERASMAPSGRTCVEPGCGKPAGTPWGPYWCPDCDDKRMDRVSASLESLSARRKADVEGEQA